MPVPNLTQLFAQRKPADLRYCSFRTMNMWGTWSGSQVGRGTWPRLCWSLKVLTNRHWHPSMGLRTWEEWRLRQIKKSEVDENFAEKCEKRHFWILSNRKMWNWSFWCCCEVAATKKDDACQCPAQWGNHCRDIFKSGTLDIYTAGEIERQSISWLSKYLVQFPKYWYNCLSFF